MSLHSIYDMLKALKHCIFWVLVLESMLGFGITDSWAWSRHNLITHYALQGINFKYNRITVTPYTYHDNSLNPKFKILYTNPDPAQITPPANKYFHYTLQSKGKPGFRGAEIGQETSARQILTDYSDEPDWGMDQKLDLSFVQRLMGSSQGYRHMYYPAWGWHLPNLFFPQGVAPQRAEHFYKLAKHALAKGDLYWTFRFLARVMHYIEDMGQPYHTSQTYLRFINISSPIAGTTQTTKNYHFAYESYVSYRLKQEDANLISLEYITALKQAPAIEVDNVAQLLKDMARVNNKKAGETFQASINLFGLRLRSKQKVNLNQADADSLKKNPHRDNFDLLVRQALELTGGGVRGFLEYIKRELPLL